MYNPRPLPPNSDFVVNFENSLGNISGSIPVPLSLIFTDIHSFSYLSFFTFSKIISIFASSPVVNFAAFLIKLLIT